jgi:hypothetical protein
MNQLRVSTRSRTSQSYQVDTQLTERKACVDFAYQLLTKHQALNLGEIDRFRPERRYTDSEDLVGRGEDKSVTTIPSGRKVAI